MRLGGATGAPPASRSGHHDRSQPAPPPPMLRNGGSGAGCSLRPSQFHALRWECQPLRPWRVDTTTRPNAPRRTTAAAPATPCASQRGLAGPAAHVRNSTAPLARPRHAIAIPTSIGVRPRSRFAPSNTPRQFERPRRSQRARLTPPVTLAASARSTSNAPPLRDHERAPRNQRQQNHERPQSRFVRARLRCSSRASLPLTPRLARLLQQLECALPLRSGQRQSQLNGLLRAVGSRGFSYASSAARVPTALKKLSQ